MLEFDDVHPMGRDSAIAAFASEDPGEICNALVAVAMFDDDWRWGQDTCLRFLNHDNLNICALAATCLGHIARIHGRIDREIVLTAIKGKMSNLTIKGILEDACEDIETFANS